MGWSVYRDPNFPRFAGYAVPAFCDFPGCNDEIVRGLNHRCEFHIVWVKDFADQLPGCEMFFCKRHLLEYEDHLAISQVPLEHPKWISHVLSDESWKKWREQNPEEVLRLEESLP